MVKRIPSLTIRELEKMPVPVLISVRDELQTALLAVVYEIGTRVAADLTQTPTIIKATATPARPRKKYSNAARARMSRGMRAFWARRRAAAKVKAGKGKPGPKPQPKPAEAK